MKINFFSAIGALFKALPRNLMIFGILVSSSSVSMLINFVFFSGLGDAFDVNDFVLFGYPINGYHISSSMGIVFDFAKILAPYLIAYYFFNKNYLSAFIWLLVFSVGIYASLNSSKSTFDNSANTVMTQTAEYKEIMDNITRYKNNIAVNDTAISDIDTQIKTGKNFQGNILTKQDIKDLRFTRTKATNNKINDESKLEKAQAELKTTPKNENQFTKKSEQLGWLFSFFLELISFAASFSLGVKSRRNLAVEEDNKNRVIQGEPGTSKSAEIEAPKAQKLMRSSIETQSQIEQKIEPAKNALEPISERDKCTFEDKVKVQPKRTYNKQFEVTKKNRWSEEKIIHGVLSGQLKPSARYISGVCGVGQDTAREILHGLVATGKLEQTKTRSFRLIKNVVENNITELPVINNEKEIKEEVKVNSDSNVVQLSFGAK